MGPAHDEARSLRPWLAHETKSFRAVRQTISGHSLYGETPSGDRFVGVPSRIRTTLLPPQQSKPPAAEDRRFPRGAEPPLFHLVPAFRRGQAPGEHGQQLRCASGGADVLQHLDRPGDLQPDVEPSVLLGALGAGPGVAPPVAASRAPACRRGPRGGPAPRPPQPFQLVGGLLADGELIRFQVGDQAQSRGPASNQRREVASPKSRTVDSGKAANLPMAR